MTERDRWKLLLEINNHVIAHLDVRALFRAASNSLRRHFANDYAAVWTIDQDRNRLECAVMDFPASRGFLNDIAMPAHKMKKKLGISRSPAEDAVQNLAVLALLAGTVERRICSLFSVVTIIQISNS